MHADEPIVFSINNREHKVYENEFSPTISLNEYLRDALELKGTKVMCREGGCGACAVTVTVDMPLSPLPQTFSINSCLCPLYCVDGWKITTVEGIGSETTEPHPIQKRIAEFNGSQCGYCTPGMVMNMYGLLHQNKKPSQQYIEDNFDGNICRCTGYRPILDAMKSFAVDSTDENGGCIDIEELDRKICPKTNAVCSGRKCQQNVRMSPSKHKVWHRPKSVNQLRQLTNSNTDKRLRFVFGYTSTGIFKESPVYDLYVDLRNVAELYEIKESSNCIEIGANTSLTKLINVLPEIEKRLEGFNYFTNISDHIKKIGNVLMRNAACWAGNMMIKHSHPEFPSDIFTCVEAAGAHLGVLDLTQGTTCKISTQDFLTMDMKNKLITKLFLYHQSSNTVFKSYKIMARSQNVYAYVNAAFKLELDESGRTLLNKPSIVFGGLGVLIHAQETENYLTKKPLTDSILQEAVRVLSDELKVEEVENLCLASVEYRRQLAINLLYKTLLGLSIGNAPKTVSRFDVSNLSRALSSGTQTYQTKREEWPLKQPIIKLSAIQQACGETVYVDDMPSYRDQLYAALVLAGVSNSEVTNMDFTEALAMDGVVDVVTADDIPGVNQYLRSLGLPIDVNLEIISKNHVDFAGQILAVVIAESQSIADQACSMVDISYRQHSKPILSIQDGILNNSFHPQVFPNKIKGNAEEGIEAAEMVTTGECEMGTQYHFYLENQITLCAPVEDGMEIHCASQSPDLIQAVVAQCLAKPANYVNVTVPKVGGAFGGKSYSTGNISACCALASYKTKRPVKLQLKMEHSFELVGKRFPVLAKYQVGHDKTGKITSVVVDIYYDVGWKAYTAIFCLQIMSELDQGYNIENWLIRPHLVKTNKPPQNACRSPACFPAGFIIESIVEHVARALNLHPVQVKERNLYQVNQVDINGDKLLYCTLPTLWQKIKEKAEVETRIKSIEEFNEMNTWKKRALTMTPVKYGFNRFPFRFTCEVSIYASDGTVTVCQGGIEMGQGLHTKVAQSVAATLNIPLEKIKVRSCSTFIAPNNMVTANSISSELCVQAAYECSEILKKRIQPIRDANPELDWAAVCAKCNMSFVDLTAKYTQFGGLPKGTYYTYFTYAVGVTEVEVDVLTGENQLRRVDIMFDCGESLNPLIDIGQIEGAYVMGLGTMLSEDIIYHPQTGRVLNNGTWDYQPPTTKDIPIDFRIELLPDAPNPVGIKGSKAIGEPPIVLSTGALSAITQAINTFNGKKGKQVITKTVAPLTVEKIQKSCVIETSNFTFPNIHQPKL